MIRSPLTAKPDAASDDASLAQAVAYAPDVIWRVDAEGTIVYANRPAALCPGCPAGDIGVRMDECLTPVAYAEWQEAVARWRAGAPFAEQLVVDGERCLAIRLGGDRGLAGGALVVTIRDISAAYVAARRAERAELRCNVLAEVTGSVIYERPLESHAAAVSPSMRSVFGYEPALARARGLEWWLERVHEDDHEIVRRRFDGHGPGRTVTWSVEYRVLRDDGTWAVVQDQGRTLDATNDLPARAVGIITDVTRVKALQGQLQHSQRLEMVGRLAAGVAHDFNNVLSAIGGFATVLMQDLGPEDPRVEDLRQIERLVDRAAGLTGNLLGLTRQREHGRSRLVNVAAELDRLAPTLRVLLGSTIELRVEAGSIDLSTAIDPGLFDQVILNLAANARDATAEGGRVSIEASMAGTDERPRVRVAVRDNGAGIPPQVLARIFQPFFTTKPEQRGTGLGLWLVREIVEAAGGVIEVQSTPLEGTVVTLDLPAVDEPPSGDPDARPAPVRHADEGRTVLLIEDEEPVRYVTRRILERNGFRVLEAAAGQPGLDLLVEHRRSIDVIVTDLHMQGLAGAALVQRLRDTAPEIGCLVVSGLAERFGAFTPKPYELAILAKPCDAGRLVREVGEFARATVERRTARN